MRTSTPRAFTLIEIVIAIAVMGIIASITTVAISSVRNNTNEKAIQSNLSALQLRAELYYREHQEYAPYSTGACNTGMFQDPAIAQALAATDEASPRGIGTYGIHCRVQTHFYGVWVQRPEGSATPYWCIDSQEHSCGVELGLQAVPSYQPCDCVSEE